METQTPHSPPPPPPPNQEPPSKKPKMSTTTSDDEDQTTISTVSVDGTLAPTKPPRYKRRKVAIFFAYCGVGYQGMQKNPGAKTIEADLEEALFQAGAVPDSDRGQSRKYDFARSARTDKGVSAVGQVVSGRFYVDPPGFVERLNDKLPDQIRVFGYKRVTGSFHAKKFCDRRRYMYFLPVFALDGSCHRDRESVAASLGTGDVLVKCLECSERGRKVLGVVGNKRGVELKNGSDGVDVELGSLLENGNDGMNVEIGSLSKNENDGMYVELGVLSKNGDEKGEMGVEEVGCGLESKNGNDGMDVELGVLSKNGDEKGELGVNENENEGVNVELGVLSKNGDGKEEIEIKGVGNSFGNEEEVGIVVSRNENGDVGSEIGDAEVKKSEFCYGDKERERFNRILKCYEGTHNFHNFTTRTKADDPSAQRYIISFNAEETVEVDGIEFVKCEVVGQSFMLHQIRKMIGLAVAIMRGCAPESLIETAFRKDVNINVPMAPEVGLYLDECFFYSYNNKWKDSHEEVSMKAYAEEAEEFKMKYIFSHIASAEHKDGAVALWLHSLNYRNYPDLRFVSTDLKNGESQDLLAGSNGGSSSAENIEEKDLQEGTNAENNTTVSVEVANVAE